MSITCESADLQSPLLEEGQTSSRARGIRRGSTRRRARTLDKAMETTARALAGLGKDSGPSKGFQSLIRSIGEAKTKHVSSRSVVHAYSQFARALRRDSKG